MNTERMFCGFHRTVIKIMDVTLILKVSGVGILVSVLCQVLSRSGREEQALLVSISGLIVVLLLLVGQLGSLIESVRRIFGI